jgi:hypothetical protein
VPYYVVECEAPAAGYGPSAVLRYDSSGTYIHTVEYLDLEFLVWGGGELIQDKGCFCVTDALWRYLSTKGLKGVSIRPMTVTVGDQFRELYPGRTVPTFQELVIAKATNGKCDTNWILETDTVPQADMFSGVGLPLVVTERVKDALCAYGVSGLRFEAVRLS